MEVMFYQLLHAPLERALPQLLEKTLERNWRAVVQAGSGERVAMLDTVLWTYREDSFLAHGAAGDGDGADHPVYLTTGDENPNSAHIRFFVDGLDMTAVLDAAPDAYQRAVLMFDGTDDEQLARARAQWKKLKDGGFDLQYWQQKENGGWEKKA
ncbi:MAG: DNA polymerase III subunit chi [Hyphomicrobiales bacterium]|nr:DNA polymerase III subunit chi [Hyphomicrobiales bacterium]